VGTKTTTWSSKKGGQEGERNSSVTKGVLLGQGERSRRGLKQNVLRKRGSKPPRVNAPLLKTGGTRSTKKAKEAEGDIIGRRDQG